MEKGLCVWIDYGLKLHMTPTSPKIIHGEVNTAHFCEGFKIRLRRNKPSNLRDYKIEGDVIRSCSNTISFGLPSEFYVTFISEHGWISQRERTSLISS